VSLPVAAYARARKVSIVPFDVQQCGCRQVRHDFVLGRARDLEPVARTVCCRQPEVLIAFTGQALGLRGHAVVFERDALRPAERHGLR
jgi:hypothetical protein